jgi:quinol-cytochrome oxidoreductase complex cytochrome b subunit
MFALSLYLIVFGGLVFYAFNVLNHPDNCIPADFYETPRHVVPE